MIKQFFLHSLPWLFALNISFTHANNIQLPSLGDNSSSVVSLHQEYKTGQQWLRAFQRQVPISEDPLVYSYLHDLIQRLAFYSPLQEKYFSLLVVDSKAFNAFAVPGNVIGINTGLFSFAETEDQLSSVIAHELAHLSQRHYARTLERRKSQSLTTLAALLGSLLILAAGDADAGIAALTATQAAAISNQLKYSRLHEQEADRIGMETLHQAGMNPEAVANMFQHMLVTTRYRTDIKEYDFLLTHPLSESRVSDAFNQSQNYPKKTDEDSFEFHIIKARLSFLNAETPKKSIDYFKGNADKAKFKKANQYGLALSLLADQKITEAATIINALYKEAPHRPAYVLAKIDLLAAENKLRQAISLAQQHLSLSPNSYALTMKTAKLLIKTQQEKSAAELLISLIESKQYDGIDAWFLLAETQGLAGNTVGVHLARAEYFERIAAFTQAQKHLKLAIPLLKDDPQARTRAELRIQEIEKLKRDNMF